MKNQDSYLPTKYKIFNGVLRASTDTDQVGAGSWLLVERVAKFYDEAIPKHVRGRLVDLGCGKAPLFVKYKSYASTVTCVDWGNSVHGNTYLDIKADLCSRLPLLDESFDTIIISDVLEHIPDPLFLWSEMARILARGGKILLNVPYFYPLHEKPYDFYRYSSFALKRFAEQAGFDIVELDELGGSVEVIADILAKHIQAIPIVGRFLAKLIQRVVWLIGKTSLGRKISIFTSKSYPLGYFMVVLKK